MRQMGCTLILLSLLAGLITGCQQAPIPEAPPKVMPPAPEVEITPALQPRQVPTPEVAPSTLPEKPRPATKAELIEAVENLRQAMLDKIDSDIDSTAQAFADVKDYWKSKRWADIFKVPLVIVEGTVNTLSTARDFASITREANSTLGTASTMCEVISVAMMLQDAREAGEKLEYGLHGPAYISAIENMLEAADATFIPPFDKEAQDKYNRVIKNHLYRPAEATPLIIPRKSTTIQRKNIKFATGALEVRTGISQVFQKLITDIESNDLPPDFSIDRVIAQLENLKQEIIRSRSWQAEDITYETYLHDGKEFVLQEVYTILGAVGSLYSFLGHVARNLDKQLEVEMKVEVLKAAGAVGSTALLYSGTYKIDGLAEHVKVAQKVFIMGEILIEGSDKTFKVDAEEEFYMLPQEMVLSLPIELSNLWMIADDTDQYLRYLLGITAMFDIGDTVKVTNTGDSGLRIHKDSPTGETIIVAPDGWALGIIGGPLNNVEGYNWWEIREESYEAHPVEGWVAEDFIREISPKDLVPDSAPDYFISAQDRVEQVIEWATALDRTSENWRNLCLRFIANAFGQENAGYNHPNELKNELGDEFYSPFNGWNPPRGALIFFSGQGSEAGVDYAECGHIGIYLGNGEVVHAYGEVKTQELAGSPGIEREKYIDFYMGWAYPPEEWISALGCQHYVDLGDEYYDHFQYEAAITEYNRAIELFPNCVLAYCQRGRAYVRLGFFHKSPAEMERAIEDFNKTIELDPEYVTAYHGRGYAYGMMGEYEQGLSDCSKAIELDPDSAKSYNARGGVYSNQGQYELAVADYNTAIELDPESPEPFLNRAGYYYRKKRYDLAIADCDKVIELDPKHPVAYAGRGTAYSGKGKYDLAIADLTTAIELYPEYALAYANRGYAYYRQSKKSEAIQNLEKAISISGDPVFIDQVEQLIEKLER